MFDQIGIKPGSKAVDLGCGPRGCLDLLSERVGKTGSVIGVERSEETVALARRFVEQSSLGNVEVRQGDARATGLPRESFDVASTRLVLVNVPEPREIVQEAVALVRSGGTVAYHEADYLAHVCDPPLASWLSALSARTNYRI